MKRKRFKPPGDIKQWWIAPCCGPGTLDADDMCGFCGESHRDCAAETSEFFRAATREDLVRYSNSMLGAPEGKLPCGGSGLWCSGCGRFWAQNVCGDCDGAEHLAADGNQLHLDGDQVSCVCGVLIMLQRDEVTP